MYQNISAPVARISEHQNIRKEHEKFEAFLLTPDTLIRVSAGAEDGFLHIQVANESPSIPDEHLDRIFDKFYRITNADRVTGTGLGLSICKGIVEAHGGKIWAENEACCFVFHFTLPLLMNGVLPSIPKDEGDG